MRLITRKRLKQAAAVHPRAKPKLNHWERITRAASWKDLNQTRATFPHADPVTVKSGRKVIVFNIANDFRLITAIHFNLGRIFILKFLTHAEYSKDLWRNDL